MPSKRNSTVLSPLNIFLEKQKLHQTFLESAARPGKTWSGLKWPPEEMQKTSDKKYEDQLLPCTPVLIDQLLFYTTITGIYLHLDLLRFIMP